MAAYLLAQHAAHNCGPGRRRRHQRSCAAAAAAIAATAAGRGGALLGDDSPAAEALGLLARGHACPREAPPLLEWSGMSWRGVGCWAIVIRDRAVLAYAAVGGRAPPAWRLPARRHMRAKGQ